MSYVNHADVALAPHHLEVTLSYWALPIEEPRTADQAIVRPEARNRLAIPAAYIPELIDLLASAYEAHRQLEQLNDEEQLNPPPTIS